MDTALLPAMLGYKDLTDAGLTRRQFDRLIESEEYERIAPGQFLRTGATDDTTAAWMAIGATAVIAFAVVGGVALLAAREVVGRAVPERLRESL